MKKFQIFYQPTKAQRKQIESFYISYSEFDVEANTCKEKIVLEKNGEKHKIKRCFENADTILSMLEGLDLSTLPKDKVDYNDEVYCIKLDSENYSQNYSTNNCEVINELLRQFKFDEMFEMMQKDANEKTE